jgi:hypothetical protein
MVITKVQHLIIRKKSLGTRYLTDLVILLDNVTLFSYKFLLDKADGTFDCYIPTIVHKNGAKPSYANKRN